MKNVLKVGNRSIKHTYECSIAFGQFPCSWIRIRVPNTRIQIQCSQNECGSRSGSTTLVNPHPSPPKHKSDVQGVRARPQLRVEAVSDYLESPQLVRLLRRLEADESASLRSLVLAHIGSPAYSAFKVQNEIFFISIFQVALMGSRNVLGLPDS
jgi:hypothetical protein